MELLQDFRSNFPRGSRNGASDGVLGSRILWPCRQPFAIYFLTAPKPIGKGEKSVGKMLMTIMMMTTMMTITTKIMMRMTMTIIKKKK